MYYYLLSISTVEPYFSSIIWNHKEIMLASTCYLNNIFLLLYLNVPVLYLDHRRPPGWILAHPVHGWVLASSLATNLEIALPFLLPALDFKELLSPHWDS